ALAPKRPDQAFSIGVLPWRPRRYGSVANPHRSNSTLESLPVGAIIVSHEIGRCRIPRKRLYDLLREPLRSRIAGYGNPQKLPPFVTQNNKGKQRLEGQGWNHADINRRDGICMVLQECAPTLRWRATASDHVLGNGRLRDFKTKLEQLAVDSRRAPQRVLLTHSSDEIAQFRLDPGPTRPG